MAFGFSKPKDFKILRLKKTNSSGLISPTGCRKHLYNIPLDSQDLSGALSPGPSHGLPLLSLSPSLLHPEAGVVLTGNYQTMLLLRPFGVALYTENEVPWFTGPSGLALACPLTTVL